MGDVGIFLEICWTMYEWKKSVFDVSYRCEYRQNNLVIVVEVGEPNSLIIPVCLVHYYCYYYKIGTHCI